MPVFLIRLPSLVRKLKSYCRARAIVLSAILSLCFITSISAATYYVDNVSPLSGDDAAHGSESSPWRTLAYGIGRVPAGEILSVKSGTYHESGLYISANRSGTASSPTRIEAHPGAVVTLSGGGLDSGRVKITGCSHLVFDGFIITNFNQGIFVEASTNIIVQNCTVHDVGQEGIHVNANSSHITIQNCTVYDTGKWKYNGEGIYVGTGSKGPPDNTAYVTIRSNVVHNPGAGYGGEAIELKPGTHDCIIEYNTVYNAFSEAGVGAIEISESALGVQLWASNPKHIIRNNVLHDTHTAIRAGTGCLIYNNVIYGISNGSYGVLVDNPARDDYARQIFHNTIDLPPAQAVRQIAGIAEVQNNIGPRASNNIVVSPSYFVNAAIGNYHLLAGSAPIGAGIDLSSIVTTDIEGNPRTKGRGDLGAYGFNPNHPASPENLTIRKNQQ